MIICGVVGTAEEDVRFGSARYATGESLALPKGGEEILSFK